MATTMLELPSAWRKDYLRASFRGIEFHTEAGARESGRRIAMHEFPKKELPYAEDMGRRAIEFTVRGYIIVYPRDEQQQGLELYRKDYRPQRDKLMAALEQEGPGELQLPTSLPLKVVCQRYRLTEEDKLGGYCTFDMTFSEFGVPPNAPRQNAAGQVQQKAAALSTETKRQLTVRLRPLVKV